MNEMNYPGNQRGFSLLEVLVAFAILAMSLGVLSQIFTSGMRNTQLSARYSEAMILAESRLAVASVYHDLKEGSDTGSSAGFQWSVEVTAYEGTGDFTNPSSKLLRVQVTINWEEYTKNRSIRLSTLRLGSDSL